MAQAIAPRKKRGSNVRHWCFTSFLEVLPVVFDKDVVRYCLYQREISPETKRKHYQGYIEFFDCRTKGQVKKVLGECHLEARKGSRTEARNYCRKKKSAIPNTLFEFGTWREDVTRKRKLSDLLKTNITLDDLIENTPHFYVMYHRGLEKLYAFRKAKQAKKFRNVVVEVLIGPTGSGKTRRAAGEADHFFVPCSDRLWFDGYRGERTLILDDFYGNIKYSLLLRILDGYELQLPIKGGFIWAGWTKVIITSNAEPGDWYKKGFTPALARRITNIEHLSL